jgi:hypothetical protein
MLLPGIVVSTSADDFAPIKQMQLMKFDGDLEAVWPSDLGGRQLTCWILQRNVEGGRSVVLTGRPHASRCLKLLKKYLSRLN